MQEERDQHTARLKKLDQLGERGIDAFPSESGRTHTLGVIAAQFSELKDSSVVVSGRIMAIREHGKSAFISLRDGSADLQCFVRQDGVGEDQFSAFGLLDIGDIVEVSGKVFETKRGEKSIDTTAFRLLAKALRPLPEKWHGLSDTEKRYRQRYLDILTSPESKSRFLLRSKIVSKLREFLDRHEFIEVETPVLQPIYGGAAARPFTTHYDALDADMYLRISDELYLKRLIVGGLERVYEIGKDFRNEGIDTDHLQEFSMLEFYWAYTDYDRLMDFTEELISFVLDSALGSRKVTFQGNELDFSSPLPRLNFYSLFEEKTGISLRGITDPAALRKLLEEKQIPYDSSISTLSGLIDHIYKKTIRPTLVQPVFLVDYPFELVPLAKRKKDDPSTIAMFQLVAAGSELVKAYNELNDPIDQRDRMLASQTGKDPDERYPLDEDYLRALEHGMPPTAGFGLGIDRFTMLLSDTPSIRDVVLFPTLKPKEEK